MVVITNIQKDGFDSSGYSNFCIDTWKRYCNKWNIPLKILTEDKYIHPKFAYLSVFDEVDSDKVIFVDVDTMINPNSPNLMELFDDKITVVRDYGKLDYIISENMKKAGDYFEKSFPQTIDKSKFFNSGFMMFKKEHKLFLDECKEWVEQHYKQITEWSQSPGGRGLDQVPFNWFIQKKNIELNYLDTRFNRTSLIRKDLNPNDNFIIHFRGPKGKRKIKKMYDVYKFWFDEKDKYLYI